MVCPRRILDLLSGVQGPDFRVVIMLRNGALRMKQNLSNAHKFVVC